ncbi:hypothetical protein [Streptomyces sp. NBC_01618]|uniref:hypothetical protein n=1 Tax=Streptomyces sp. NBC_01618 TaxID=2975900 RepID=UPI00386E9EF4
MYFRDTASGRVAHQPRAATPAVRTAGGPGCDRFYASGDSALCLRAEPGVLPKTYAIVLDRHLREVRRCETPLAETRSVDDQAAWLDDGTVACALPGAAGRASDIWTVPADGTGAPRPAVTGGSSPVAVG